MYDSSEDTSPPPPIPGTQNIQVSEAEQREQEGV